jgi:hypothetical protein
MKKYNIAEIEDIALRYAYNKKSLTQKNVECFIAGFKTATNKCQEDLQEAIQSLADREKKFKENYDYDLGMGGYMFSRPKDYDETVSNHNKLYKALQNLADVLKETGIKHKI